jgi:gluconate 2-dehydrogenase gamma chain
MQGPFNADAAPELGYQLQLSPQQIYRLGIAAVDGWCKANGGQVFAAQDSATRDRILSKVEAGELVFDAVPAKVFFSLLVQNTREGFFCDPIHGGNKGMVGWTQIGFPAPAPTSWTGSSATSLTRSRLYRFAARGPEAWRLC